MKGDPQGRCETTLTERFENDDCRCGTYVDNTGPCKTFVAGVDAERCVYCDHKAVCHPAPLRVEDANAFLRASER